MQKGRVVLNGALAAGVLVCCLLIGSRAEAYDGPSFSKGLWLFQRSTEFYTKHWLLPNARRVQVERPVVRCVDPTQAMVETFRPTSVGNCQSSPPKKQGNTFVFAKRCDYMGPVKTTISVESDTGYREINELLAGSSPKRELVVARRVGECGSTPDMAELNASAVQGVVGSIPAAPTLADHAEVDISAARRANASGEPQDGADK